MLGSYENLQRFDRGQDEGDCREDQGEGQGQRESRGGCCQLRFRQFRDRQSSRHDNAMQELAGLPVANGELLPAAISS